MRVTASDFLVAPPSAPSFLGGKALGEEPGHAGIWPVRSRRADSLVDIASPVTYPLCVIDLGQESQYRTLSTNTRAQLVSRAVLDCNALTLYLKGRYDGNSFQEEGTYQKGSQENRRSTKTNSLRYSLRQGIHRMSRGRR